MWQWCPWRSGWSGLSASPVSQGVADAQELMYGPVIGLARRSALHTDALGHSVHPMLTDVTFGCWLAASILDLAGGSGARHSASLVGGCGDGTPQAPSSAWRET